jgi:hypothetical protein
MHQLQHPPPPAINFPLALLVQQLSLHLVVTSFMLPSYPWPPPKRLASNQQYSRPGYADLIIQRKPIARTRINAGSWGDGVAQHIKGGEIGLGVFVGFGAAVAALGGLGLHQVWGFGVKASLLQSFSR